jgi:ribosomal protein L37AE/L43A
MNKAAEESREKQKRRLAALLSPMADFLSTHASMNSMEFDYYTVQDMTLFTVEPSFDFDSTEAICDRLLLALPAIKRIFSKPIINLIDNDDVLPVETVHIINQSTMLHLANHSENVANLTNKGVKPRKLLTRVYEDDYSIYENVVFCNFIDETLKYVRERIAALKDLVYANEVLDFNLLERANHLNYFLSIGKLHTGYIRDFEQYAGRAKILYAHLQTIANTIQPRLVKPIYEKNKIRNRKLELKKTNIFLMQKDYHQVYVLYKRLLAKKAETPKVEAPVDSLLLANDYFLFVETIALFGILNFNFSCDPSTRFSMEELQLSCAYKKWSLTLKSIGKTALLLEVNKNHSYRLLLVPSLEGTPEVTDEMKEEADEVVYLTPFEEDALASNKVYISVENIESFRRIQQLVLKAMVYADETHDDCPFCHGKLIYHPKSGIYECDSCHLAIASEVCPETKKSYWTTGIVSKKKNSVNPADYKLDERWLYERKVEGLLYFRNITKITDESLFVCPYCGKSHAD